MPAFIITETKPTPLIRDFAAFTRYLSSHKIILTRANEFIPGRDLYEINRMMTHPLQDTTPRTGQTLYPLLHLFYHIVLAGKLFQKVSEKSGSSGLVLKHAERLRLYEELKPAEKYFFLLETFWADANWKKLQAGYFGVSPLYTVPNVLEYLSGRQPGKKIIIKGKRASYITQMLSHWEYFLLYFSFFGFWEVTRDTGEQNLPKQLFRAESITPTAFGVSIAQILSQTRNLLHWNLPNRREHGEWKAIPGSPLPDEKSFFLPFIPLFAEGELQKTLPREGLRFVDGTYVFRVSLAKNIWRRIVVSANHTLLDLHNCIQESYNFDDDHLYSLFMDGKLWSRECFNSPYDEEGPYVDDVRIGELGLSVGQKILYLFDFGDMWCFQIELEEIRTEDTKPREPKIIEKKGKAPKQYG